MSNFNNIKPNPDNQMLVKEQIYISPTTRAILKSKSSELGIPLSRLVAIAIDNELDSKSPFNYPCQLPESPYIEDAFLNESHEIYKWLDKFKHGIGRDTLMLCRRDIGILSRSDLLHGLRELIQQNLIEEYRPLATKFNHAPDYKYFRTMPNSPEYRKMLRKSYKNNGKKLESKDE